MIQSLISFSIIVLIVGAAYLWRWYFYYRHAQTHYRHVPVFLSNAAANVLSPGDLLKNCTNNPHEVMRITAVESGVYEIDGKKYYGPYKITVDRAKD